MDRALLFERINLRMDHMIEKGLFEEADSLKVFRNHNALQSVGYSEIFKFMDDEYDKEEAIRLLKRNSRRYAKRQLTWFHRYDDIHWFEPQQKEEILSLVRQHLSGVL
jgi:tRNA dimethylallyltransferase